MGGLKHVCVKYLLALVIRQGIDVFLCQDICSVYLYMKNLQAFVIILGLEKIYMNFFCTYD